MIARRAILGVMVGTLGVAAAFAMPALGAPDAAQNKIARGGSAAQIFFTPASADPKLAALIARSGLGATPFRFTPTESRGDRRPIDIVARVRTPKAGIVTLRGAGDLNAAPVGVAPIAYNLAGTTGAKRLSVPTDGTKLDLGTSPASHRPLDIGMSIAVRRNPSRLKTVTDRGTEGDARLTNDLPIDPINVGGAYSLSRNIDLTAGVRYKSQDRNRFAPLPDDHRDSQAVYVGTAFRF